jgi:hypothetical protein
VNTINPISHNHHTTKKQTIANTFGKQTHQTHQTH